MPIHTPLYEFGLVLCWTYAHLLLEGGAAGVLCFRRLDGR